MKLIHLSFFLLATLIACASKFPKDFVRYERDTDSLITFELEWPVFYVYYNESTDRHRILIHDPKMEADYFEVHRSNNNEDYKLLYRFPQFVMDNDAKTFYDPDCKSTDCRYKLLFKRYGKVFEKPALYYKKMEM